MFWPVDSLTCLSCILHLVILIWLCLSVLINKKNPYWCENWMRVSNAMYIWGKWKSVPTETMIKTTKIRILVQVVYGMMAILYFKAPNKIWKVGELTILDLIINKTTKIKILVWTCSQIGSECWDVHVFTQE